MEKETRVLQNTNNKLENSLVLAEQDNVKLLEEMKARETSMIRTQKTLTDLGGKTEGVREKNKHLESECTRLEGDCQTTNTSLNI